MCRQDAAKRLFSTCSVGDGRRADLRLLMKVIQHQDETVTKEDVEMTFLGRLEEAGLPDTYAGNTEVIEQLLQVAT